VNYVVRFQHCDPVGIVFYPQYFNLLHQVTEDWFADGLKCDYHQMHSIRKLAIPVVHTDCDFLRSSKLSDLLTFELVVSNLGKSSFGLQIVARHKQAKRLRANFIHVFVDSSEDIKSIPILADLREKMKQYTLIEN